jgi:hypothetical protein
VIRLYSEAKGTNEYEQDEQQQHSDDHVSDVHAITHRFLFVARILLPRTAASDRLHLR